MLLSTALAFFIVFTAVFSAATSTTTVVNVCNVAAEHNVSASPQLIIRAAPTSLTDVDVAVGIEGCTLPNGLHLTIAVPAYNGTYNGSVTISIRHVTMHGGGSLIIKPDVTTMSSVQKPSSIRLLQNVHVDVEHSALEVEGDLLVVDATANDIIKVIKDRPSVMQNVSISVQFSTLWATGNVASFLTPDSIPTTVRNVHIYIGTNTNITSQHQFMASIAAMKISEASIVLHSASVVDPIDGSCNGGPVTLHATNSNPFSDVRVLSVVARGYASMEIWETVDILVTDGSELLLCNGRMLRQCSAVNNISVVTKANGTASVGSVSPAHSRGGPSVPPLIVNAKARLRITMHVLNDAGSTNYHQFRAFGDVASLFSVAFGCTYCENAELHLRDSDVHLLLSHSKVAVVGSIVSNSTKLVMQASSQQASAIFSIQMFGRNIHFAPSSGHFRIGAKLLNVDNVVFSASTARANGMNSVVMGVDTRGQHDCLVSFHKKSILSITPYLINISNVVFKGSTVFGFNAQSRLRLYVYGGSKLSIVGDIVSSPSAIPTQFTNVQIAVAVSFEQVHVEGKAGTFLVDVKLAGHVRWTLDSEVRSVAGVFIGSNEIENLRVESSVVIVEHALTFADKVKNSLLFSSNHAGAALSGQAILRLCLDETVPRSALVIPSPPVNVTVTNTTAAACMSGFTPGLLQQLTNTFSERLCWAPLRPLPVYLTPTLSALPTTSSTGSLSQPSTRSTSTTHTVSPTQSPASTPTSSFSHRPTTTTSQTLTLPLPATLAPKENDVSEAVLAQKTTVTVVATTVLATSAANAAAGPGLQDMQALVVLGSMACASGEVRTVSSGGDVSVVPFELPVLEEGTASRGLLSMLITLVGVVVLHAVTIAIIMLKTRKPFTTCCGMARFPAWSFSAFVLLYQGMALLAFTTLFSPSPSSSASASTDRGLGSLMVLVCVAAPLVGPLNRMRGRWPATFVPYEHAFSNVPKPLRSLVFPAGFYDGSPNVDPDCIVRRYSPLFTGITVTVHPLFLTLGLVKALLIALVASLPEDDLGCTARFSIIGSVSIIIAVVVVKWQPWRVPLNNLLSCLSNLCTAALCFASARPLGAEDVSPIITATVGLGLATSASGIVMKALEAFKWKKEEQRQRSSDELYVPMLVRSPSPSNSIGNDSDATSCGSSSSSDEEDETRSTSFDDDEYTSDDLEGGASRNPLGSVSNPGGE